MLKKYILVGLLATGNDSFDRKAGNEYGDGRKFCSGNRLGKMVAK